MFPENLWKKLAKWGNKGLFNGDTFPTVDLARCQSDLDEPLKYVWLNLATGHSENQDANHSDLNLDDWLNIIDESAALGANSMVVDSGVSLSDYPGIWKICDWAQSTHGMHVGLHVQKSNLTEEELSQLSKLHKKLTCLVVDTSNVEMLDSLNGYGIPILTSNVENAKTFEHCTESNTLACVEADGTLQKCGLVACIQRYPLGNALSRPILEMVKAEQEIANHNFSNPLITSECGACPTMVAQQLSANKSKV
jgi:radical SAM protein with 4Fe4S-binding SPASM domain